MNEDEQFKSFYATVLAPELESYDALKKKYDAHKTKAKNAFIISILIPFLFTIDFLAYNFPFIILISSFVGFCYAFVHNGKSYNYKMEFRSGFKRKILPLLIKKVNPDWQYYPNRSISRNEYETSGLFWRKCDRFSGDDLVVGQVGQTDFRSSELHTQYEEEYKDKDGKTQSTYRTIFQGFFFHADFNKDFKGETYVLPALTGPGREVKLENPEFANIFSVSSTCQVEARYLLTPAIMEAILRIRRLYRTTTQLSFVGSRVYVAIDMEDELFEADFQDRNYNGLRFIFDLFKLNETIIKELNLNTRIWTKE